MIIDKFTEISAERFKNIESEYRGHSVILFPYRNYRDGYPTSAVGLWLSRELVKRQIEAAHYIPDSECADALRESRGVFGNTFAWLGLFVETDYDSVATLTVLQFMLEDFDHLAQDKETPLKNELEERFGLHIRTE